MNTQVKQESAVSSADALPDSLAAPGPSSILTRLEAGFDWCFRALIIFTGLALAVLMFTQVVLRYGFDSPFAGIEEVAILLGVWIYFLGMGYATRAQEHIHGGIVSLVVKDPFKLALVRFFSNIVCVIAAGIFGYFAIKYSLFVIEKGRLSLYLKWPKGLWSASMIAGFTTMTGYFLLHSINELRTILRMRNST
ncbi:TRAP transporter small permease [Marinobacterium jannaschii]|uniref:TRAP transporter small permease n=1 Tax=Marinobacterium jannaschii TaxID=64970 RepID=UPI0006846FDF|nr:TRAP transporter small permease subunit [Marinobacterium jannaschii]